jgi:hypothetical protein
VVEAACGCVCFSSARGDHVAPVTAAAPAPWQRLPARLNHRCLVWCGRSK